MAYGGRKKGVIVARSKQDIARELTSLALEIMDGQTAPLTTAEQLMKVASELGLKVTKEVDNLFTVVANRSASDLAAKIYRFSLVLLGHKLPRAALTSKEQAMLRQTVRELRHWLGPAPKRTVRSKRRSRSR